MQYNYDYFISYSHKDNEPQDGKPGFVDEFVEKLRGSQEHQEMFGKKMNVFFDKTQIRDMSDWDNRIRSSLASSRFLIVLLSPGYFRSEYCAREFDWWMQHEMHRRMLGEGTAPMLIVDVARMYDYQTETIPDIPENLQARFPNWLKQIRRIQSGPKFDVHDLDRAKISDALDSLREEVKDKVRRQNKAENSPNNTLYPRYNENFVGRRENLRSLRKSLTEKKAATYSALTGLGGFGKTELALTYGHAFAWDYQLGRVFAKCENKTSIAEVLLTSGIAEMHGWELPKEGTDEQKLEFLKYRLKMKREEILQTNEKEGNLNTLGTHILLILDNVNRLELISKKNLAILPDFFHAVITTRENTNEFPYIHSEPVERLSEDESVELLSNLHSFADKEEARAARDIAKLLTGFTLAVELVGAYLEKNKYITYRKQYERLVANHAETFQKMADKTGDLTLHTAETVSAVLESTLSALSDNARKGLDFVSLMPPDTVALGWLPELLEVDEDEGNEVISDLLGYSLLTPSESEPNIARIHRLVAKTVKEGIPEEERKEINDKIREKCEALLEKDKTFWCASENSWNIAPVSEFCLMLAEHWTIEASEDEIDWGLTWMLGTSGNMLNSLGKMDEAKKVFQSIYEICEERGKTFPSNNNAQRNLSVLYNKLGDMENAVGNTTAAREWYEKALKIRKRLADNMPDDTVPQWNLSTSYGRLGDMEKATGNTAAAREWYEKSLEIYEKLTKKMPEDVTVQRAASIIYERLGDLEKATGNTITARELYEKALEIHKRLSEKIQNDVGVQRDLSVSYERLGNMENDVGNAAAAREWYEKALEIYEKLAKKMPEDVTAQRAPSVIYERFGNLEKADGNMDSARTWYTKALEIAQLLAEMIPDNLGAQRDLSEYCNDLGNLEIAAHNAATAKEWSHKAFKILEPLVEKTPDDVETQKILGKVYRCLGDSEKAGRNIALAREWYKKALEVLQRLADKMPENEEVQENLAEMQKKVGPEQKQPWYVGLLGKLFGKK